MARMSSNGHLSELFLPTCLCC